METQDLLLHLEGEIGHKALGRVWEVLGLVRGTSSEKMLDVIVGQSGAGKHLCLGPISHREG